MSNKALNWAFQTPLPPMQKLVLLALADLANEKKGYSCFPGHGRLVEMTGASEKTIQRAIKDLAEKGLLSRQRRTRSNGSRTSDLYVLAVTATARESEPNGHSDQAQAVTLSEPSGHSDPPITISDPVVHNQEAPDEPDAAEPPQEVAVTQGELIASEQPEKEQSPEHWAAQAAYEHTGKALNFMATRGHAKWLINDRGLTPENAARAIVTVYQMGKPNTRAVLGQLIDGHIRPAGTNKPTTTDRISETARLIQEMEAEQERKTA